MLRITLLLIFFASTSHSFAQLYSEDFLDEADGATTGTAAGTPGGTWSTSASSVHREDVPIANEIMLAENTGTEQNWQSNVVDISSAGYAVVSVDVWSALVNNDDYLRLYYRLDGGSEILFYELQGGNPLADFTPATPASAIVSGNSLQIVARFRNNTTVIFFTFNSLYGIDNVTITPADVLYSRKSSTWTDVSGGFGGDGTWSTSPTGTPACGCVPLNDVVAVIQNGHTVTLPTSQTAIGGVATPNLAPGGVDIRSGGILNYNVSGVTLGVQQGLFRVRSGGIVNSSSAAITGETISFNADLGGASIQVDAGSSVTIENLTLAANASNLHYMTGGGTLTIGDDIRINADGATLTNNMTSTVSVTDRIHFMAGITGSEFVNNGTVTAKTLYFEETDDTFINNATATLEDIFVATNTDDNNTVDNNSQLTLTAATSIDVNSADLFINNSGTINQSGNFADLVAADNFVNEATGTWNWSLNANTIPANFATAMDCSTSGNTFVYNGTSNQNIGAITYHHLTLSSGGTKTPSANMDINGNLSVLTSTTLSLATTTIDMDVEGAITVSGTGVIGGGAASNDNIINIAGSWSAATASSFEQAQRTVIFDGGGGQTISNPSTETFYNLTINNGAAANTMTLQNDITVTNTLTLTRGRLALNGNMANITRNANGAITGASANSYVISESTTAPYGKINWTVGTTNAAFTFPFGTSTGSYVPYILTKSGHATVGTGIISVATYGTAATNNLPYPTTVTHLKNAAGTDRSALVVDRFWIVDLGYGTVTGTQSFAFTATEGTGATTPRAAQRWNGTDTWLTAVGSAAPNNNPYVANSSTFPSTVWVVASATAALPVELTRFSAHLENHEVHLNWKTASEKNNHFFTIEKAQNLEQFVEVGKLNGHGTTAEAHSYSYVDPQPIPGRSYYRLKQTDFDGTSTYSSLEVIDYEGPQFAYLNAYPSPGDGTIMTLELKGFKQVTHVPVEILNSRGVVVWAKSYTTGNAGNTKAEITFSQPLSAGLYIVRAGVTKELTQKIVIK